MCCCTQKTTICIIYDFSDNTIKYQLAMHLRAIQIKYTWVLVDHIITAGSIRSLVYSNWINNAEIIIFLLSASFLNDEVLLTTLSNACKLHKEGWLFCIPVVARQCSWQMLDCLQNSIVLPCSGQYSILSAKDRDAVYNDIVLFVRAVVEAKKIWHNILKNK